MPPFGDIKPVCHDRNKTVPEFILILCQLKAFDFGRFTFNNLRSTVMLPVYCDLQGKLAPTLCILNSRTSLLRVIGNPTDSLQFASRYQSTHVNWYPTRCAACPEHGIKVRPKPEFDV